MKSMIRIRNNIIIVLCLTIILLGVGFILLSVKLKQIKDTDNTYSIVFDSIKLTNSVKGSTIEPNSSAEITNSKQEIAMKFSLNAPHDEISYTASIVNNGNISAEIVDIMESPDYKIQPFKSMISPIAISLTDIKGKIISPGEKLDLKITVYYNPSIHENSNKTFTYKLSLITMAR